MDFLRTDEWRRFVRYAPPSLWQLAVVLNFRFRQSRASGIIQFVLGHFSCVYLYLKFAEEDCCFQSRSTITLQLDSKAQMGPLLV